MDKNAGSGKVPPTAEAVKGTTTAGYFFRIEYIEAADIHGLLWQIRGNERS